MPTQAPFQVFEKVFDIQAEEVLGGHVNFSNFFRYVGGTFHAWYTALGIGVDSHHREGGPVMASVSLDYKSELFYPGQVRVRLTVTRIGRSSLEHLIEVLDAEQGRLCACGRSVNVWKDRSTGKGGPWPESIVQRCWT